jgi:hypothetical protein
MMYVTPAMTSNFMDMVRLLGLVANIIVALALPPPPPQNEQRRYGHNFFCNISISRVWSLSFKNAAMPMPCAYAMRDGRLIFMVYVELECRLCALDFACHCHRHRSREFQPKRNSTQQTQHTQHVIFCTLSLPPNNSLPRVSGSMASSVSRQSYHHVE